MDLEDPALSHSASNSTESEVSPITGHSAFDKVSGSLLKLGTLTLEDFHRDPWSEPKPQDSSVFSLSLTGSHPFFPPLDSTQSADARPHQSAPIFILHQACSQVFGSLDPLKYEFIEDGGLDSQLQYTSHHAHTLTLPGNV